MKFKIKGEHCPNRMSLASLQKPQSRRQHKASDLISHVLFITQKITMRERDQQKSCVKNLNSSREQRQNIRSDPVILTLCMLKAET